MTIRKGKQRDRFPYLYLKGEHPIQSPEIQEARNISQTQGKFTEGPLKQEIPISDEMFRQSRALAKTKVEDTASRRKPIVQENQKH